MTVIVTLLAIVVALLAVLVVGLLRTNADVMRALDRLGEGLDDGGGRRRDSQPAARARTGRPGTDLSGETLGGGVQVVRVADVPHDTLLLFLSSGCLTCWSFWDALNEEGGLGLPHRIRVAVVTKDLSAESPSEVADLAPTTGAIVLHSSAAWTDYEVPGSPYAVLVDGRSGTVVGEGTGGSWQQVSDLLAQATGDAAYAADAADAATGGSGGNAGWAATERDSDAELLAAGIRPGDPSLYPNQSTGAESATPTADSPSDR